jgi:hypothetical protein
MKAHHAARIDIDRQREPGALHRGPGEGIHDNDIHQGVIDLYQRLRPLGLERSHYR